MDDTQCLLGGQLVPIQHLADGSSLGSSTSLALSTTSILRQVIAQGNDLSEKEGCYLPKGEIASSKK
jgi:hypothetical protein